MFRTVLVRCRVEYCCRGLTRKCANLNRSARTLCAVHAGRRITTKVGEKSKLLSSPSWNYRPPSRTFADYPNYTRVVLPALSPTMEEGTIISWEKKEGDKLNEGDLLAEIETDKATMAFETPEEGYLAKILVPAGTKGVPIGKLVCVIVENEADVAMFKDFKDDAAAASAQKESPKPDAGAPAVAPPKPSAPPPPAPETTVPAPTVGGDRVYASPMAKKLAEQRNIRLQGKGTGLFDSITSSDLAKMAAASPASEAGTLMAVTPPPGAAYVDTPVSNIRAVIAKRLTASKQQVPHYYLTQKVYVNKLEKFRSKINKMLEKEGVRISVNDIVIKATAMACSKVPESNSYWMDSVIRQFKNVDVSVAVATDRGLFTPIIFEANVKGVTQISKEMKTLAAKAREGKLQPSEFQGGTVSVSNLGMFGLSHFSAIINPPQSLILAVGGKFSELVADEKAEKGFRESDFMNVTISCDHRLVDGAVGARWLQHFKRFIEDPETMLL